MNCDCIYCCCVEDASLMANGRHSFVAFYPSDWLAGTARMTRLHRSIYFDICCYIWDIAKPVPERELRVMIADVKGGMDYVEDLIAMEKLERLDDGSITNAKALHEAEKARDLHLKKSAGGKAAQSAGKSAGESAGKGASIEPEPEPELSPKGNSRGTKLPDDFAPLLTEGAQDNWNALRDPERELQQFRDHHTAKGSVMKDWQAAFRTWLSNAVKYQERGNGRTGKSAWLDAARNG